MDCLADFFIKKLTWFAMLIFPQKINMDSHTDFFSIKNMDGHAYFFIYKINMDGNADFFSKTLHEWRY